MAGTVALVVHLSFFAFLVVAGSNTERDSTSKFVHDDQEGKHNNVLNNIIRMHKSLETVTHTETTSSMFPDGPNIPEMSQTSRSINHRLQKRGFFSFRPAVMREIPMEMSHFNPPELNIPRMPETFNTDWLNSDRNLDRSINNLPILDNVQLNHDFKDIDVENRLLERKNSPSFVDNEIDKEIKAIDNMKNSIYHSNFDPSKFDQVLNNLESRNKPLRTKYSPSFDNHIMEKQRKVEINAPRSINSSPNLDFVEFQKKLHKLEAQHSNLLTKSARPFEENGIPKQRKVDSDKFTHSKELQNIKDTEDITKREGVSKTEDTDGPYNVDGHQDNENLQSTILEDESQEGEHEPHLPHFHEASENGESADQHSQTSTGEGEHEPHLPHFHEPSENGESADRHLQSSTTALPRKGSKLISVPEHISSVAPSSSQFPRYYYFTVLPILYSTLNLYHRYIRFYV